MKIDSYAVQAASQRSYQKFEVERVELAQGDTRGSVVSLSLSEWAQQALAETRRQQQGLPSGEAGVQGAGGITGTQSTPTSKEELKLQMLESFLSALTGRQVSLRMEIGPTDRPPAQTQRLMPARARGGAELVHTRMAYERESVSYAAQGVVKTADGKTINVDVSMQMSREFASFAQTRLNLSPQKNLVDPLVINYGGPAASLTGEKFAFDLDSDGALDQISFAGAGSGFLALDKNGDGTINDGSELFGPGTGNGFGELRAYDRDGNNWIDESDEVFSKLRIWSKDENGNDQLFTLLELGIGAIYLGDVSTQFDMGEGVMRSTSFFLREDGSGAGTVSHIDLRV